jgi:hypothetical protein
MEAETSMATERQHAHELIDRMAPGQVAALVGLLEAMLDPAGEEEERAVAEARQWLRDNGGKGIPHEEVLADFGLTTEDFHRMGEKRAERRCG